MELRPVQLRCPLQAPCPRRQPGAWKLPGRLPLEGGGGTAARGMALLAARWARMARWAPRCGDRYCCLHDMTGNMHLYVRSWCAVWPPDKEPVVDIAQWVGHVWLCFVMAPFSVDDEFVLVVPVCVCAVCGASIVHTLAASARSRKRQRAVPLRGPWAPSRPIA